MELEHQKPGSCEVLTRRLLQRLGSANESSVKGLHEFSSQIFHKSESAAQNASDCKMNLKTHDSSSLSPLASFLLSRWQGEIMQDSNLSKENQDQVRPFDFFARS